VTAPQRVQLSRAKGWRMPPNTMKVDRSTRWGNPFNDTQVAIAYTTWGFPVPLVALNTKPSRERGIDLFMAHLKAAINEDPDFLEPLRGKNLACWCHEDELCHADVLLLLANARRGDT
jgi:hypothetical protein